MDVRHLPNQDAYERLSGEDLRKTFLLENLFVQDKLVTVYLDADRAIVGGVLPVSKELKLLATKKEMAAEYFAERREVGIINAGGPGAITVDGTAHVLETKDVLYIGRGARDISFKSQKRSRPAAFYLMSYPAHAGYPTNLIRSTAAIPAPLGSSAEANKRTIYKYIHAGGAKSCQLVMGMTELEPGSVWNTMPCHTHLRRSEVYWYFNLDPEAFVVHLMGTPNSTRNLIVRDRQAVVSPSWSVHCGAGTKNYSFVWAMGGENQEFGDMDVVPMKEVR